MEVVPLEHASAEDLAEQVAAAVAGAQKAGSQVSRHLRQVAEGGGSLPADMYVVPAAQANSLVLVGTPVQLAELKRVIALLDVEPASGYGRLNAVFLKYLSAAEAAKSLNALLAKTVVKDERQRVAIEPSPSNNALLVDASPRDFQWVRELIEQLDQAPQQVMVEILIAEVGLGSRLDLGMEWSTVETPSDDRSTVIGRSRPGDVDTVASSLAQGAFPQGLSVGVARGLTSSGVPRVPFLLTALKSNQDLRILSSVPLWAQNNAEATVSVVENIPILRSTIQGGSGTSRDVIQNIDRVDVGIKLKVTPHVNPDGEVTLQLNPSIEAIVDPGPAGTDFAPTIAKREVSTTVTVADGTTVVLSGLIREDRTQRVSRVPLLGDIPVLGHLFRFTSDEVKRKNLLLFVTPSIVTDGAEAARIRASLEDRTGLPGASRADASPRAVPEPEAMRLAEILARGADVPADALERAAAALAPDADDAALAERLVADGALAGEALFAAWAGHWSLAWTVTVDDGWLDPSLVERVPLAWSRARGVLPVRRDGQVAALVADPADHEAVENLALLLGGELVPVLAPRRAIRRAAERCHYQRTGPVQEAMPDEGTGAAGEPAAGGEDLLGMADGAPVTQLVNADPAGGPPDAGLRRARRAAGGPAAGALPHGRLALRTALAAPAPGRGADLAAQGHGPPRHRRAAAAAGRHGPGARGGTRDGRARLDRAGGLGRAGRAAAARQAVHPPAAGGAGHARGDAGGLSPASRPSRRGSSW